LELVARQLGHRDVVMVATVYGRFVPTHQERDRWEQAAAALDAEEWSEIGTAWVQCLTRNRANHP